MKKLILLIAMSVSGLILTACAIPGVTEPFDNKSALRDSFGEHAKKNSGNNAESESVEPSDKKKYIPDDMQIHNVGDKVEFVTRNSRNEDFKLLKTCTINSATVYEQALDSGISESDFSQAEIYEKLSPLEPHLKLPEEFLNSRFLLCDLSIGYEDLYLEENPEHTDNITFLELIYVYDDKSYVQVGFPCYLSNGLEGSEQWNYNVSSGETVNLQVGWIVDAELFKLDEFDLSRLYLGRMGDEDFMRVIYLGLTN